MRDACLSVDIYRRMSASDSMRKAIILSTSGEIEFGSFSSLLLKLDKITLWNLEHVHLDSKYTLEVEWIGFHKEGYCLRNKMDFDRLLWVRYIHLYSFIPSKARGLSHDPSRCIVIHQVILSEVVVNSHIYSSCQKC